MHVTHLALALFVCVRYTDRMKSAPFISLLAKTYHVEEKTLVVYARFLREAGLLTTGARGVNAPNMLPLDAARLTIALLATESPARAVESVKRFAPMTINLADSTRSLNVDILGGADVTFERVLVRIFCAGRDNPLLMLNPYIEVDQNAKRVKVEFGAELAAFSDQSASDDTRAADRATTLGIRRMFGVASSELMAIWVAMWADRFTGFDAKGLPLSFKHPWNDELRGEERIKRFDEIEAYVDARDIDWRKGLN